MSTPEETTESATTLVAAALEEQIRRARFIVQVSEQDKQYGYLVDRAQDEMVLSACLPLDEVVRRCIELRKRPYKYCWMKSTASVDYLGFGSAVVHRPGCGGYLLVMVPAEHASWQIGRLYSGMAAVLDIYETAAEALVELAHGKALGVL